MSEPVRVYMDGKLVTDTAGSLEEAADRAAEIIEDLKAARDDGRDGD